METSENESIKKARLGFFALFLPIGGLLVLLLAPFAQTSSDQGNDMAKRVSKFKNDSAIMTNFSATIASLQKRLMDTTTDSATVYRQIQGSVDSLKRLDDDRILDTPGNHHFYTNVLASIGKLKQSVIALRLKGQSQNLSDLKDQKNELQNTLNMCQLKQAK